MLTYNLFYLYNLFIFKNYTLRVFYIQKFIKKCFFVINYYSLNELIWQEGLLVDFLQKKIVDNWIKKFLIASAYLFNERLVYDKIIRFYLILIVWPAHRLFIFEYNNVANTLFIIIFFFLFIFFLTFLIFIVF